jgi:hypothetical protein
MRDAFLIGALYLALGVVVTALAGLYAGPRFWEALLWGGIALATGCVASLCLSYSHQATGRPFLGPALAINLGLCLVIIGFVWHFWKAVIDADVLFYFVDIRDPKDISAQLPIYIASRSPGTFEKVDPWWSPWGSEQTSDLNDPTSLYYSIGGRLKLVYPWIRGNTKYGLAVTAGDYLVEYNATLKDINYHFDEHLVIQNQDGILVQKIDVWRVVVPGGERVAVYSGDSSKGLIQ